MSDVLEHLTVRPRAGIKGRYLSTADIEVVNDRGEPVRNIVAMRFEADARSGHALTASVEVFLMGVEVGPWQPTRVEVSLRAAGNDRVEATLDDTGAVRALALTPDAARALVDALTPLLIPGPPQQRHLLDPTALDEESVRAVGAKALAHAEEARVLLRLKREKVELAAGYAALDEYARVAGGGA